MPESTPETPSINPSAYTAETLGQLAFMQQPALHQQLWHNAQEAGSTLLYAEDTAALHTYISQILTRHNTKELTLAVHSLQPQLNVNLLISNAARSAAPAQTTAAPATAVITQADYILADTASIAYTRLSRSGVHELYSANVNIAIADVQTVLPGVEYLLNINADYTHQTRILPPAIEIITGSLINQLTYQPQVQYLIMFDGRNPETGTDTRGTTPDSNTTTNPQNHHHTTPAAGVNSSSLSPYKLWQTVVGGKWFTLWLQSAKAWFQSFSKAKITTSTKPNAEDSPRKFRFTLVKKNEQEPPQNSFKE